MTNDGFEYLEDGWNINDIIMQSLIWVYCSLRIGTDLNGYFMIVQGFEFTDRHKETEYIQKMFSRIVHTDYMKVGQLETDNRKYATDYHHTYIGDQTFMSILHTIILFQSTVKLFFFFKIFDTIGLLIKTLS